VNTVQVRCDAVRASALRTTPSTASSLSPRSQVWDENADPFTNTVTVTIARLRRKLGQPPAILTTPGAGYRIAYPEDR
jgi:DNA-binding response OmpR family regulator